MLKTSRTATIIIVAKRNGFATTLPVLRRIAVAVMNAARHISMPNNGVDVSP